MKTVFITGASRGIGKALAVKFKNCGYNVVGTYNQTTIWLDKLSNLGIDMIKCDVTDKNDVTKAFDYVQNKYGKLDVVINNAGVSLPRRFILDVTEKDFNLAVFVNLKGTFFCLQSAIEKMLSTGGVIVNVSSIFGLKGGSCEAIYSASKAGVIALSTAVSQEVSNSGVKVMAAIVGMVDTDMNASLSDEEKRAFISESGLKKLPTARDVASRIFSVVNNSAKNGKIFKVFAGKVTK